MICKAESSGDVMNCLRVIGCNLVGSLQINLPYGLYCSSYENC